MPTPRAAEEAPLGGEQLQAHLVAEFLRAAPREGRRCGRRGRATPPSCPTRTCRKRCLVLVLGEHVAAAGADEVDEEVVHLLLDRLQARHVLRLLRLERVEDDLGVARRVDAPLDAELVACASTKPKPAETTPMEPTIEAGSTTISSPAQAIM